MTGHAPLDRVAGTDPDVTEESRHRGRRLDALSRVDRAQPAQHGCGWPACPLFLWLVLGPEADALALVVLMVSGITDFLDG